MAADRKAAAENLALRRALEARAATEQASVATLLRQREAQRAAAADDVADDKARYAQLQQERSSVERRIADPDRQGQGRGGGEGPSRGAGAGPGGGRPGAGGQAGGSGGPTGRAAGQGGAGSQGPGQGGRGGAQGEGTGARGRAAGEGVVPLQQCAAGQQQLHLPGPRVDHLAVRAPVPPDPALLEAARRNRLPRRLRHEDPGAVHRAGSRRSTTTAATATG